MIDYEKVKNKVAYTKCDKPFIQHYGRVVKDKQGKLRFRSFIRIDKDANEGYWICFRESEFCEEFLNAVEPTLEFMTFNAMKKKMEVVLPEKTYGVTDTKWVGSQFNSYSNLKSRV